MVLIAALVALIPPTLAVGGNQLYFAGQPIRLQGVDIPGLESANESEHVLASTETAFKMWKANCVRLSLSQDRWFGKAPGQTDEGRAYRALVDQVLDKTKTSKGFLILNLSWSNMSEWGKNLGPHNMPDSHSLTFWRDVAYRYRTDIQAIFELYDAPEGVSWPVWRNGGNVPEGSRAFSTPGMQSLVETIRATGAKNVIIAGGLDRGYDLTGIVQGYQLLDRKGFGIVYRTHLSPTRTDWEAKINPSAKMHPVIVGGMTAPSVPEQEDPITWVPRALGWMADQRLSWTASAFDPSISPSLLADWDYNPSDFWGIAIKSALAGD